MEKRGIDENEQRKIDSKIRYLEARFTDSQGLVKSAGGDVKVDVIDWDNEYVYFGIKIAGELKHTLHYPLKEFLL